MDTSIIISRYIPKDPVHKVSQEFFSQKDYAVYITSLRKVRFMCYYILTTGMNLLKVSSKGQIVIPEEIRRKLGLQKGSLIKAVVDGNKIVLVPAIEPPHEAFVSAGPNLVMQALKESKSSDDRKLRTLLRALGVKG